MYFNNSRILDMCKYSYLSNKSELEVNEIYNLYSNYGYNIVYSTKFNILKNVNEKPIYIEKKSECNTSCFIFQETLINKNNKNNNSNNNLCKNQNNIIVSFSGENLCSIKNYNYKKSVFKFPYENNDYFNIYPKVCDIYNQNFEYIKENLNFYLEKLIDENFMFDSNNSVTYLNSNESENNILLQTNNNRNKTLKSEDFSYNIIFCGYNSGGAYAQLAALYYKLLYPNINIYCISYSSPRIGNYKFIDLFQKYVNEYLRIEHINDLIPLKHSSLIYKHHNNVLYIGINDDDNKKYKLLYKFKNIFYGMLNLYNFKQYTNYTITDYLDYLENL